ncbi:hypothetical protein ACWDYH_39760 [Nocardia goodfellowii]
MTSMFTTNVVIEGPVTAEYRPARGYTIDGIDKQYWIPAQVGVRVSDGGTVTMALDIEDARSLVAAVTAELAKHDIATADYSVDLSKAVA